MTAIQEILKTIHRIHTKGKLLSKNEMLLVLEATKSITTHKQMISSLIFFFSTFESKTYSKQKLTKREQQIVSLIGNGLQSKTIAIDLDLSISTIETHRKNIRRKLAIKGKGKLFHYALLSNMLIATNDDNYIINR
jgi:DNA-binding CsgD family transcriptional regulator